MLSGRCQSFKGWASNVANPPTISIFIAVLVGVIARLAPSPASALVLVAGPLITAVEYSSRCLVPVMLFCLGSAISEAASPQRGMKAPLTSTSSTDNSLELTAPSDSLSHVQDAAAEGSMVVAIPLPTLPTAAYVAIVVLRQIFGPLLGAALGFAMRRWGGLADPVALMVTLLQSAGPPMINLSVMAGLAGGADTKRECALVLLVTYAASVITWVGAIAGFFFLIEHT